MGIDNGRITDRGWEFSDNVTFQVMDYDKQSFEKVQDDYAGAFKPVTGTPHPTGLGTVPGTGAEGSVDQSATAAGKGLVIRLAATHAGLITRNNGFYLPDKMRAGAGTFTDLYPKPIQVHHEDHKDPVGRVVGSRYVETVGAVVDRFKNHVLRDSRKKEIGRADLDFWKDFCGSDKSFIEKLQMIKLMDNVLSDKHYRGVGFIELTADITDPDAIQKVLDGRFLTGSVGAVSDKAVCSICNTNWLEDEHCGHKPGRTYEDKKCFVVAGGLEYDEYSFVNTPADRHSGILSIESGGILDSVRDNKDKKLFFYPIADYFHEEDSAMENETTAKDPEVEIADAAQTSEKGSAEEDTTTKPDAEAGAEANVQDAAETSAESVDGQVTDESTSEEAKIEDGAGDVVVTLLDKVLAVEEGKEYDFELSTEEVDSLYDALVAELPEDQKDAKLSSEQRKKLPKSSFCGPNRSFPVPDCAHVTAARRLIGRASLSSSQKSDVLASVTRKSKALGCSAAKDGVECDPCKDSVESEKVDDSRLTSDVMRAVLHTLDMGLYGNEWDPDAKDEAPALKPKEIDQLKSMIQALAERIGEDALRGVLALTGLTIVQDEFDTQVAEATRLEDKLGEKNDQLNALRQELRATYGDVEDLTDQLVTINAKLRDQKVERLKTLHTLEGNLSEETAEGIVKLSDEVLDNSLETLGAKVDIHKIADKVNDGLSRTPDETIDNPTEVTTPSVTEETETVDTKPTFQTQDHADREYFRILVKEQNPAKAKAFYADMVTRGLAAPKSDLDK